MDPTNETGLSKVTVTCTDPSGLFSDVQAILSERLPLKNLHWKSPTRPARSIESLNIDLVAPAVTSSDEKRQSNDSAAATAPLRRHQIPGLRQTPYLKIYLLKCDDNEVYKASSRKLLRDWIKAHSASQQTSGGAQDNHDACEWLILHVLQDGDVPEKTSSKWPGRGSTSVLEKVKADFNGSSKTAVDRVTQIRLPKNGAKPQDHDELVDQLNDLVDKIKQAILTSFDLRVAQYEEDIREKDSQRSLPGWNFCTFFILKEGLARGFENVGLLEDALVGYDELAAGLESAVADHLSGTGDQYGDSFLDHSSDSKEKVLAAIKASKEEKKLSQTDENEAISRDDSEISLDLDEEYFPLDATKKPYRDMILANNISIFDFRAYVFSRQLNLLLKAAKAPFLQAKQELGLTGKPEDLTLLAEVCDRAMEFISMAARTLRYDIERALSEVAEEIGSAKKTAIIDDLVSSWTYAAACQILSQTVTPSLILPDSPLRKTGASVDSSTAAADVKSNVPKRSSSLMASSGQPGSKQPPANKTGVEDLASGRGELYQLGRGVLEEMGRRRGWAHKWSDLALLFGDSHSTVEEDMDEVSLDDNLPNAMKEDSQDTTAVFFSHTDLYLPLLQDAFSSRNKFHLHFEVFTDKMFRHYVVSNQLRSAKAAMTDIAVLRFRQKDFDTAAFFFRQIAPFYESSHWVPLEGAILELYARCLKELDRNDEYVRTMLRLLTQYAAYTQSYLSPKQKASVAASELSIGGDVSSYLEELLQASKDLAKEVNIPLSSFFGDIIIEPEIKHYEDKDGFQMNIKLRFLLDKDITAESIKVRLVGATGSLSNEVWLENTGDIVIKSRTSRLSVDSSTTLHGKFFVDRIEIRVQNIVFTHAGTGNSLGLPPGFREPEPTEEETRPFIWCYPPAHGLETRLAAPHHINLEELRTLEIELDSGRNNISKGLLRIRPATAGLRLRTSEITVIAGEIEMTPNPELGSIEVVDLAQDTSIRFRVPYTVDENHSTLSARLEVAYETDAGRFTYISTSSFLSTLPISVNVQDIFRDDVLLSRFTVSPAMLVPLRILGCDIPESETYKVESGIKGPLALDVFPKQPASIMYKIKQKGNRPAVSAAAANSTTKQHALRLTVRYTCIDDECLLLVKQTFSEAIEQTKYKSLTRLLTPHIVEAFREQLSTSDMESIGLIREVEMLPYDDVHWDTVLKGLQAPLGEEVQSWLRAWHKENPVLSLLKDSESLLARHIVIPVEVPEIQVVHTAELRLFTDSEAVATTKQAPIHAAVGHMVPAELSLRHTRRWCSQQTEKQESGELEFSYELHVNQDLWLLGGRRRGHFTAQEGEVKRFAVMLLPQKSGHLLLPSLEIKTYIVGGTSPITTTNIPTSSTSSTPTPTTNNTPPLGNSAGNNKANAPPSIATSPAITSPAPWTQQQRRQIPNEVDYKNHGESLLVLPDLRKTTVSLGSGNPGLIESESRIAV